MGISLGGYLAPRAAAFEHRLAALIANDGLYSYHFSEKAIIPRDCFRLQPHGISASSEA